jgi:hypothetical protein
MVVADVRGERLRSENLPQAGNDGSGGSTIAFVVPTIHDLLNVAQTPAARHPSAAVRVSQAAQVGVEATCRLGAFVGV